MLIWQCEKVGQGKIFSCPDFLFSKVYDPHIRKMSLKDIIIYKAIPLDIQFTNHTRGGISVKEK